MERHCFQFSKHVWRFTSRRAHKRSPVIRDYDTVVSYSCAHKISEQKTQRARVSEVDVSADGCSITQLAQREHFTVISALRCISREESD